jgi:hypothetical protein
LPSSIVGLRIPDRFGEGWRIGCTKVFVLVQLAMNCSRLFDSNHCLWNRLKIFSGGVALISKVSKDTFQGVCGMWFVVVYVYRLLLNGKVTAVAIHHSILSLNRKVHFVESSIIERRSTVEIFRIKGSWMLL